MKGYCILRKFISTSSPPLKLSRKLYIINPTLITFNLNIKKKSYMRPSAPLERSQTSSGRSSWIIFLIAGYISNMTI